MDTLLQVRAQSVLRLVWKLFIASWFNSKNLTLNEYEKLELLFSRVELTELFWSNYVIDRKLGITAYASLKDLIAGILSN